MLKLVYSDLKVKKPAHSESKVIFRLESLIYESLIYEINLAVAVVMYITVVSRADACYVLKYQKKY